MGEPGVQQTPPVLSGIDSGITTTQKRLNVGVVGIGRMGQRHALNMLRSVPRARLLCACSPAKPDLVWAEENLIPYGVKVYPTFEEMIETPGLEAVIVSSTTDLHMAHTVAALDRGIHVLCEKPVCTSLDQVCVFLTPFAFLGFVFPSPLPCPWL